MNQRNGKLSRRVFLKTAGAAAAGGAILTGCGESHDPYSLKKQRVSGDETWVAGEEKWIATTCGQCAAGCGIKARVVEGRAIKIEGNPDCPINRGGLGPKGQAGVQLLYHPDRIRGPLKREGPKGSGRWKSVSWEQAISEIAGTLRELRAKGEPRRLVVVDGDPRGVMRQMWERFLEAYGSPNHVDHRSAFDGGKVLAMAYMHGVADLPAYDWEHTRYVLSFTASLFESSCQMMHFTRGLSHMRWGKPGYRTKFVQVSSRFSMTSAKADEWIPIEPGTYGALALGLAHILIREKLYDEAFVREHTFGFDDWKDAGGRTHRGFRDLVLKDYPPEKVVRITGVPPETLVRLAREMAGHRPAIAVADGQAAAATNGLGTAMAIHALNALLGNLERPGGLLTQRTAPLTPWPSVDADEISGNNLKSPRVDGAGGTACPLGRGFVQGLPEAILSENPYPVGAVVLYKSNPVFSKPDGTRWIEALKRIPLVVSCSPLSDESTFWADYVLPDHTYLERWDLVEPVPSVGYPVLGLRQPVVAPLYKTMATGDVVIRLAKEIGSPVADAFPWDDYRQALDDRLKGVHEAKAGSIVASNLPDFKKKLQGHGGWWATPYPFEQWNSAFPTPSRKFEFYSQEIAALLKQAYPGPDALENYLKTAGVATRGDDLCMPHWEPPQFSGKPEEFSWIAVPYRGVEYAEGGVRHLPLLRELPGTGHITWSECIELHPADAERLGIHDGETVRVESPSGGRRVRARLYEGVRPGTIGLPLGHGPWPSHPAEAGTSGGYDLLANISDPLSGIFAMQGTRVRIRKDRTG